jgi:hypothetical protein
MHCLLPSGDYKGIPGGQPIDIRSREMDFRFMRAGARPITKCLWFNFP